jgi:hypothetical protein
MKSFTLIVLIFTIYRVLLKYNIVIMKSYELVGILGIISVYLLISWGIDDEKNNNR